MNVPHSSRRAHYIFSIIRGVRTLSSLEYLHFRLKGRVPNSGIHTGTPRRSEHGQIYFACRYRPRKRNFASGKQRISVDSTFFINVNFAHRPIALVIYNSSGQALRWVRFCESYKIP